ncbi:unnamed protein product [Adineta ricciae]|uniref:ADP/ATP translocase n=1 Tax=Adineta ricciae TaxID=249248 RepID=A0A816F9Y6_ADIRI|nr:unnamed protein product [Adineta ricciae]
MERVKLLLQTQDINPKIVMGRKYKGFSDCFVRCIREEGVLSLWRGNLASVIRYFPVVDFFTYFVSLLFSFHLLFSLKQAMNFVCKERYENIFANYNPQINPYKFFLGNLFAGGMAGATGSLFLYPLEFARTRLAVDIGKAVNERQFRGTADCLAKTWKTDGVLGVYRGFTISVVGIFIYRAFYFGGYDAGKQFLFADNSRPHILYLFLCAQFTTSSAECIAYPIDTIRRRLMMQSGRHDVVYKNAWDCARKIALIESPLGFFKGNLSNMYRSISSSLVLVLSDEFKHWLYISGELTNPH